MIRRVCFIGLAAAIGVFSGRSARGQGGAAAPGLTIPTLDPNAMLTLPSKTHATGDAVVQPSVITIHAHNQLLADVLADLAGQCGADMAILGSTEINDAHLKKVSLDVDKGSFWDAMLPLCKSAGIGPAAGPGQQRMLLVDRSTGLGGGAAMASQSSGILFIPQFAHLERLVNYDDRKQDQSALAVQILMIPEPKMQLVGGDLDNWLDSCLDDKGNSLNSKIARSSTGLISQSWGTLSTFLLDLPQQGSKIASIKGTVKLSVRTASQIITIDNIMTNRAPRTSGANSIQILPQTASDSDMDTVKVSIEQAGAAAPVLGQSRPVPEGITFLDQSGALVPYSRAVTGGGAGASTMTYYFITGNGPNVRHPATLRWELTSQTKSIDLPFELHDLDLPIARPKPAN